MTLDHLRIYSRQDVDRIIAFYKERRFAHLCAAAFSGAIMGVLILLTVQAMFSN